MEMEQTECSETSAYKIQNLGIYPEESIQHSEHDESLKSSKLITDMHNSQDVCNSRDPGSLLGNFMQGFLQTV